MHSVRFICSVVDMCLKLPTSELPPCSAVSLQRARRDVTGSLDYFTSALLRSTTTGSKEGCYWKPRATWLLTAPAPPGMLSWVAVLLCFCLRITACITVLLYYSVAVLLYHCNGRLTTAKRDTVLDCSGCKRVSWEAPFTFDSFLQQSTARRSKFNNQLPEAQNIHLHQAHHRGHSQYWHNGITVTIIPQYLHQLHRHQHHQHQHHHHQHPLRPSFS